VFHHKSCSSAKHIAHDVHLSLSLALISLPITSEHHSKQVAHNLRWLGQCTTKSRV